jgi:hypothetical protein
MYTQQLELEFDKKPFKPQQLEFELGLKKMTKCKICSNMFTRNAPNQITCSVECREKKNQLWYLKNRDRLNEIKRKWAKDDYYGNPEKYKEKFKTYHKKEHVKVKKAVSKRIRVLLKNVNCKKSEKTNTILGCSSKDFVKYIEKKFEDGMSWDNYGFRGWHLDHIIPCARFDLTNQEELRKCFHFSNYQPLWAKDNLSKNKKTQEEYEKFLIS